MMHDKKISRAAAILLARAVLGLIFLGAGIYKVFQLGPVGHAKKYFLVEPYTSSFLPTWSLWFVGFTIPFIELLCGALILIGFRTGEALLGLGLVLALVTFGHLLADPLFPFHRHVIPRLILVLFLLMCPKEEDRFSVDAFLQKLSIFK